MSRIGPYVVAVDQVSVDRAGRPVLVEVTVEFTERSRTAIVGPNGVGKSTLLSVVAGRLQPDSGRVTAAPPTATVGLLSQELDRSAAPKAPSVRQLLAAMTGVTDAQLALERASAALANGGDDSVDGGDDSVEGRDESRHEAAIATAYDAALDRFLRLGAPDFDSRLDEVAHDLGLRSSVLDRHPGVLSGGEAERVGLAAVLLSRFDLTLLDEPTNNLDLDGLDRLERWVADHLGGLVIVSHDRAFLERTVKSVIELDGHHRTASVYNGGWAAYLDERARARAIAERRHADYIAERDRLASRAQTQREWVDRGTRRARKFPADGDKFRRRFQIEQVERLAARSKASLRAMSNLETVDKPWQPWELQLTFEQAQRSGAVVAAFDGVVLQRGSFTLGPIDAEIGWAERVAIVGPNGSGKSTFLDAMLGRLRPVAGRVIIGSAVVVGALDQRRSGLDDADTSVVQVIQDATGLAKDEARSLLAKFGLDAEAVSRPASSLSPGERTRAQLARFQAAGVNLLVLDEPTNHLDLEAIEQLELAVRRYDGTLLLVTHDRQFLTNVEITRTIDVTSVSGDIGTEIGEAGADPPT